MQDAGTEEETAAAARAAAEKREERLQTQNLAYQAGEQGKEEVDGTTQSNNQMMMDVDEGNQSNGLVPEALAEPVAAATAADEDEDIDALDAFMSGLTDSFPSKKDPSAGQGSKGKQTQKQPEALFGDDDVNLNAVQADPGDILAMASKARTKKKDLPTVNHAKMNYEPFRKKFYTEPAELAAMTEEEVIDLRLELEDIKVRVC